MLCSAIPQEYKKLLFTDSWRKFSLKDYYFYSLESKDKKIFLAPTGMGIRWIINHWQSILELIKPSVIVSFGFCGELRVSAKSGLFVGTCFTSFPESPYLLEQPLPLHLQTFFAERKAHIAKIISVLSFIGKDKIPVPINQEIIVDMESFFLASLAYQKGIPFISIRATTDKAEEEIPFDVNKLLDTKGRVSIKRVALLVKEAPKHVFSFYKFWKKAEIASKKLTLLIRDLIALPPERLYLESLRIIPSTKEA